MSRRSSMPLLCAARMSGEACKGEVQCSSATWNRLQQRCAGHRTHRDTQTAGTACASTSLQSRHQETSRPSPPLPGVRLQLLLAAHSVPVAPPLPISTHIYLSAHIPISTHTFWGGPAKETVELLETSPKQPPPHSHGPHLQLLRLAAHGMADASVLLFDQHHLHVHASAGARLHKVVLDELLGLGPLQGREGRSRQEAFKTWQKYLLRHLDRKVEQRTGGSGATASACKTKRALDCVERHADAKQPSSLCQSSHQAALHLRVVGGRDVIDAA